MDAPTALFHHNSYSIVDKLQTFFVEMDLIDAVLLDFELAAFLFTKQNGRRHLQNGKTSQ